MAKMAETTSHETYRDRARQDYEERRADGRLVPAQSTCTTLDEKSGKTVRLLFFKSDVFIMDIDSSINQFNVLWLNPQDPDSFPEGLMVALTEYSSRASENQELSSDAATPSRLRLQMQADALRPIAGLDEDDVEESTPDDTEIFSSETIEEAIQFLRLNVRTTYYVSFVVQMHFNFSCRLKIDCGWYFHISATSTHTASGVERNTTT